MPKYSKEDIAQATDVNLQDYARHMGFELKKADQKSMKIEGHGGLYVFEKGFHHFSAVKKGNAIHFAREYLGMGFQEAVKSLHDFKGYVPEMEHTSFPQKTSYQKPVSRPNPPPKQQQEAHHQQAPPPEQYQRQPVQPEFVAPPPPMDYDMPPPPMDFDLPPEAFGEPPPPEFYEEQVRAAIVEPKTDYSYTPPPFPDGVELELPPMSEHDSFEKKQPAPTFEKEERGEMQLPPKSNDPHGYKSFLYLTKERGLDKDIVNSLMKQGDIFEATTQFKEWEFKNVAFVGRDKEGTPKYCALRSVGGKKFTQDVKNSNKNHGFAMKGRSNRVYVCEAPIDVISHATLTKLANVDYTQDSRISLGGLQDGALKQFLTDNPQIKEIVFALDNDKDVVNQQGQPTNHGQNAAKKFKEAYAQLGYKTLVQTPKGKDFNEDLVQKQKPSVKQQLNTLKTNTPKVAPPTPSRKQEVR